MTQPDAWRMIRRRAAAAGAHAPIGNHTFRATGITAYLSNGGALEHAHEGAAHPRRGGADKVIDGGCPPDCRAKALAMRCTSLTFPFRKKT
jgi:hypothetical protein